MKQTKEFYLVEELAKNIILIITLHMDLIFLVHNQVFICNLNDTKKL